MPELNDSLQNQQVKHRIIKAGDKEMELLHRVSLAELRELLASEPGLLAAGIVKYQPKIKPQAPFQLIFAEGNFSILRCARHKDKAGKVTFYAERKLLSQPKLHEKHETKESDYKHPDSEVRAKFKQSQRSRIYAATKRELKIVATFAKRMNKNNVAIIVKEKNKLGDPQIYQFSKIAAFKDLTYLGNFLYQANLNAPGMEEKKNTMLAYVADKMAEQVILLHALKVRHRDIKPANFLMYSDGEILLSDFGSVTYLNKKNKWEKASLATDRGFRAPQFMIDAENDEERRLDLNDQWALAISVLEIYGFKAASENLKLFKAEEVKLKTGINSPDEAKAIYQSFVAGMITDKKFQNIRPHMQEFIIKALNLNVAERQNIKEMISIPETTEETTKIVKEVVRNVHHRVAKINETQIKLIMEAALKSSTESKSSDGYEESFDSINTFDEEDSPNLETSSEELTSSTLSQSSDHTFFKPTEPDSEKKDKPKPPSSSSSPKS
ncbi:MAG: hypothetical protein EPN84_08495 [Legionella sp.]|nr:MAG: hypothetical protein EPN84_08495 [Legionella sp.]